MESFPSCPLCHVASGEWRLRSAGDVNFSCAGCFLSPETVCYKMRTLYAIRSCIWIVHTWKYIILRVTSSPARARHINVFGSTSLARERTDFLPLDDDGIGREMSGRHGRTSVIARWATLTIAFASCMLRRSRWRLSSISRGTDTSVSHAYFLRSSNTMRSSTSVVPAFLSTDPSPLVFILDLTSLSVSVSVGLCRLSSPLLSVEMKWLVVVCGLSSKKAIF